MLRANCEFYLNKIIAFENCYAKKVRVQLVNITTPLFSVALAIRLLSRLRVCTLS